MDKRIVVFLVLSLAIILGFDLLLKQMGWLPEPPPVQDGAVPAPSSSEQEPTSESLRGKDSGSTSPSGPSQSSQKSGAPASGSALPIVEQTVTVETDLVRVEFSNRGGVIRSWELKRYHIRPSRSEAGTTRLSRGKVQRPTLDYGGECRHRQGHSRRPL